MQWPITKSENPRNRPWFRSTICCNCKWCPNDARRSGWSALKWCWWEVDGTGGNKWYNHTTNCSSVMKSVPDHVVRPGARTSNHRNKAMCVKTCYSADFFYHYIFTYFILALHINIYKYIHISFLISAHYCYICIKLCLFLKLLNILKLIC